MKEEIVAIVKIEIRNCVIVSEFSQFLQLPILRILPSRGSLLKVIRKLLTDLLKNPTCCSRIYRHLFSFVMWTSSCNFHRSHHHFSSIYLGRYLYLYWNQQSWKNQSCRWDTFCLNSIPYWWKFYHRYYPATISVIFAHYSTDPLYFSL